jgi:hypothetical protein
MKTMQHDGEPLVHVVGAMNDEAIPGLITLKTFCGKLLHCEQHELFNDRHATCVVCASYTLPDWLAVAKALPLKGLTMRKIHIIGGGTVAHVRPHLALCAPAYGATVRHLFDAIMNAEDAGEYLVHLYTTKMAGNRHQIWTARTGIEDEVYPPNLETNADIATLLDHICVMDPDPSIVFLPAALCDFDVRHIEKTWYDERFGVKHKDEQPGKDKPRLKTADFAPLKPDNDPTLRLALVPAAKVIANVRKQRKDIFLVGFKTTTGAEKQEQFNAGLALVKQASCNLVLANDLETKLNMVVTPEQAPYYVSTDRRHTLRQLVGMALMRSKGHFTRSQVDTEANSCRGPARLSLIRSAPS